MAAQVLLVGAGHAHMEALRQAARFDRAGLSVTLIDPGAFWYSGAATGMLSGALEAGAARAEPAALPGAFEHIAARVACVDAPARLVTLDDGRTLGFDVLSVNTGSAVAETALTRSGALPVKPVANLAALRERIEAARGALRVMVAGAGATGVEVALSIAALQRRLGARVQVDLAGPGRLLPGWPAGAARLAERALAQAGIARHDGRAQAVCEGAWIDETGCERPADIAIAATGLSAQLPEGFNAGADGLPVGPDLAWRADGSVFAAGDCAHLTHAPRPKLGVFGVRAAPVLIDNLLAAARGEAQRERYDPQARWLSLMDLGDGTGLGRYGGLAHRSGLALALKRWIDARFVQRYQP